MSEVVHRKKRLSSFKLIVLGFAAVIFFGALLLMLPCCYTTIVVTHLITTLIWQQLGNLLQLIHDKTENLATLALHNFILRLFIGCYDGHTNLG